MEVLGFVIVAILILAALKLATPKGSVRKFTPTGNEEVDSEELKKFTNK